MRGTVQIDGKIVEERRELPVTRSVDVLVAGGGTAGLVAAVAAARTGARTLLVERNGFMGGAITAAMMAQISAGAVAVTGIGREIVDRLNAMGGVEGSFLIPIDPEAFKLIALEMLDEVGVETLLYSSVVGTVLQGDRVHGVIVENKSGRQAIQARVTIDATGDGDVCAWADAPIVKGREADGKMRPVSIIFKMAGVDIPDMVRY
ncbi:MAG: FAD-dependent oxidoreductase, partial [Chloroflexota bacterium]